MMAPAMGIFGRAKNSIKSKANAAVDKLSSPEKEIERVILELEEQRKEALKELLSYKATAKQMEQDLAELEEKAKKWEKRAIIAVKKGDDEAAKTCLREKKRAEVEAAKVRRDRDEASSYAIELNRSRKKVETRLKMLKLKKGTMATQIAAARGKGAFDSGDLFDKLDQVEDQIDHDAAMAEADAAMELGGDFETEVAFASAEPQSSDDALQQLKEKMRETPKQPKK